jgi:hypothetical protein
MHFSTKSYLKSNRYHITKHTVSSVKPNEYIYIYIYIVQFMKLQSYEGDYTDL